MPKPRKYSPGKRLKVREAIDEILKRRYLCVFFITKNGAMHKTMHHAYMRNMSVEKLQCLCNAGFVCKANKLKSGKNR